MSYNNQIPDNQGAVKASEIFTDQALEIIKNNVGDTVLACLQGMMKPIGDAIRYNNFILHSTGELTWTSPVLNQYTLGLSVSGYNNNIVLTLLMMDESAQSRSLNIVMQGGASNTTSTFNSITLAANEMVYLELSREDLLAAVGGQLIVENGINGGSSVVGKTAKKITISSASSLPAIIADMDTSAGTYSSNTVNIPLFIRYDWTDSTSHQDLWWIPHGIRWPVGTQSVVGGVVVSGINALPNYFVANKAEFKQALTNLSGDGGIIVPTVPITIDENITIPSGVTVQGRSNLTVGSAHGSFTFSDLCGLTLSSGSTLRNLPLFSSFTYGSGGSVSIVTVNGENATIDSCSFYLNSGGTFRNIKCIDVAASKCNINNNTFTAPTNKSSALIQNLIYTAKNTGPESNKISITYTTGSLLVTVTGNNITVRFPVGTTASAIKSAVEAVPAAMLLIDSITISGSGTTVQVAGSTTFLKGAVAINYRNSSNNHLFLFNKFNTILESSTDATPFAVSIRSDYGMVPIGCIIPWYGASHNSGSNGGGQSVTGNTNIVSLSSYLGEGWIICDGRELPINSPLRNDSTGSIYAPMLTDGRFLRCNTTTTGIGGSDTVTLQITNIPAHDHGMKNHYHSVTHDHPVVGTSGVGDHDHTYSHTYLSTTPHNVASGSALGVIILQNTIHTDPAGAHSHSVDIPAITVSSDPPNDNTTTQTGSGTPTTIIPKYLNTIFIMRVK